VGCVPRGSVSDRRRPGRRAMCASLGSHLGQIEMLKLLARFSPRLRAILELPTEISEAHKAVRHALNKYAHDAEVQAAVNELKDVTDKVAEIIGRQSPSRS
jgi:predicted LPLAT superfamily acyltransferase